jgi:hypothetical protein
MKLQVRTYDPRLGQEYAVSDHATKKRFSSLEHGFFVLDCVGAVDWTSQLPLLNGCLQAISKKLFFTLDPWEPGARELRQALEREFGAVREFERSLCGYAAITSDAIDGLLQLRASFGGDSTGQWCIGGCLEEFASPVRMSFSKGQAWGLPLVLEQAEKLGCVLSLGEMQQSLLVTRLFDNLDNLLRQSSATQLLSA